MPFPSGSVNATFVGMSSPSSRASRASILNSIEQAKHGGDHSSRPAQLQARENEQKALSLWIKGATFQQIAAAGFGIATASGAWRSVGRALARIPKQEADQAREAQFARLQAVRMLLWNHAGTDPVRAAEALIKLEVGRDLLRVTRGGGGTMTEPQTVELWPCGYTAKCST